MKAATDKLANLTGVFLGICCALILVSCGDETGGVQTGGVETTQDSGTHLGKLPAIYQKYIQELTALQTKYQEAGTEEEKDKIKTDGKARKEEFKAAITEFNQTTPLTGTKLPFKVMGELPFDVQSVTITSVEADAVKFIIQVKINQDIKRENGELSQRTSIYFAAYDTNGNVIPDTDNYGTNHGWIELSAGTIYDAQGHWNAERVQNMGDFDVIKIMSEADYKKIK